MQKERVEIINGNTKKNTDSFKKEILAVNPDIIILGEYEGSHKHIKCQCKVCGYIWDALPSNLLKGRGCRECGQKRRALSSRLSNDEFVSRINIINPDVTVLSPYITVSSRVLCICNICGNSWNPVARDLLSGGKCPICNKHNVDRSVRKSPEVFENQVKSVHPAFELLGEYVHSHETVRVRCKVCNNEWDANPSNLLKSNYGCPRCAKSSTSFMEQFILLAFREMLGENQVLSRDKTTIGLELDIVIPALKVAFEPGTWHLHKKIQNEIF